MSQAENRQREEDASLHDRKGGFNYECETLVPGAEG